VDRPRAPRSVWVPPETFEEYRLLRVLGKGAMGTVYLAHDGMLDRQVAIKFITDVDPSPKARERFFREAQAAPRIQHRNVVSVHRVGELDDHPFIISELLRGKSLDQIELPLPWRRVLELAIGLARGLAAVHRAGILHRDLKPANAVISGDGEVK